MKKRVWITAAAVLLVAATAAAVLWLANPAEGEGVITVGIASPLASLDPAAHRDRYAESVLCNLYDALVIRTPDGDIAPALAESWTQPEPGVWEFTLRKNVRFHNGGLLTAEDVRFTFERIMTPGALWGESSPRRGLLGPLEKVEAADDRTVRFTLSEPWPVFLDALANEYIVSKAYVEKTGEAFAEKPMGTGPFTFVEGSAEEGLTLRRFGKYYGGSPGMTRSDGTPPKDVRFAVIPELSRRIGALQTGDADIIHEIPASIAAQLAQNPDITLAAATGTRLHIFEMNVQTEPFKDVRVRQAMNYAVDIDAIIREELYGYAEPLAGPVPSGSFARDGELAPYGHDPAKARRLLAEAGLSGGISVELDTTEALKGVAEAAARQLREAGIDVVVKVWDWGELYPLVVKGERAFVLTTWSNANLDPHDLLEPKLGSSGRGNYCAYANPALDELLERAARETGREARRQIYTQAQKLVYDDAPWIFGYVKQDIEAARSGVNWQPSPDGHMNLYYAARE